MRSILIGLLLIASGVFSAELPPVQTLKVSKAYSISLYAYPVPNARSMTLGPKGVVFAGTRTEGKVYAILPPAQAGQLAVVKVIADNLTMPNGIAYYQGSLYVAEPTKLLKFENIMAHLDKPLAPKVITDKLPKEKHHHWRYMAFGPDGKLYIAIGAPCDSCLRSDTRYASIMRMNPDGSEQEVFARGIRNSVGFDWHPETKALWFTDNGRDWLGDNSPPDELNIAPKKDLHFGFPYCFGRNVADPFYNQYPCSTFIPPVQELPAHVAALGMRFIDSHRILIAEHGSWNRSEKDGYQVVEVVLDSNGIKSVTPFVTGWLQDGKAWGRPVDVLVIGKNEILISDDKAGAIYKVTGSSS